MKIFLVLLTAVLIVSCAQNSMPKTDNLSKPVVEISPISNQAVESNPFPANEITATSLVKIPAFPTPEKISKEDFLRQENRNRLSKFGLYDLETKQIPKDDIEIRIWQISDLYMSIYKDLGVKESVFILKRTNEDWSARVLRNTINQKSGIEKQIKTKLDMPQLGWENVWQNLISNELLTFPDSVSREVVYGTHAGNFITESKVDGIFKTYQYSGNQEVREIQYTARIFNIIAEEFDLEDFQATREYEE